MRNFDFMQTWAGEQEGPPGQLEMTTPTRPAGFVSDLVVPLGQSVVTGAFVAGLVVFVLSEVGPSWEINGLKVWAFLTLAISAGVWVVLLKDTRQLLRQFEKLTGLDLDGDGTAGEPVERLVIVNAGREQEETPQQESARRVSQFAQFVSGLPSRGTGLRGWEKDLSRETYQEYRDALIRLGWARWKSVKDDGTPNERQGWELVKTAPEILARIGG
jgi:hypothetical protein